MFFLYLFKGHDVEEIRVRTLKNLLSKLELKLLYEEDVIQEQSLLIRLLEWFNFPSCSMQTEVLQLIKTLSKHASASELFVRIGAVEFLSELRQDLDPHIQNEVDDILENLFKLPESDKPSKEVTIRRYSEECHYYPKATELSDSSPGVIQDPIFDSPLSYFSPEVKHGPSFQEQTQGLSISLRPPQLEDQSLILKAISCLSDLSRYLCERYHFYHDPDLYCPKQEFGVSQTQSNASSSQGLPSQSTSQSNLSSNSRPSVIGHQGPRVGGDGKDWDSPSLDSPSAHSEAESEDPVSLQFSQVTLPQFCVDVLQRTLSIYQDFTGLDVSSRALPLVWRVVRLIKLSISSEIWSETGLSGRALIEKLNDSLELLADILIQSNHNLQQTSERSEVIERYLSYVSLIAVTVELTVGIVPHSMGGDITKLLSLGELSLPALMFPETLPVVEKFVLLCSSRDADSNQPEQTEKLLLKFLLNPSTAQHTLNSCRSIVEESLNVSQPRSKRKASHNVRFLLHSSILKSLAEQLSGHNETMKEAALSILLHLLTGKLLMVTDVWNQFITTCGPSLALIQAQAYRDITLQHAVRALLIDDIRQETKSLTHLQQLRVSLRFLLMKDSRERTDLARFVMKYLKDERDGENKLPPRSLMIPEQISMLLLMEKPLPLEEDVGRSVFQVESLVQMFSIFKSPDTDESLRKSSADQLGIILQDRSLHQAFLSQDGPEIILEKINLLLQKKRDTQGVPEFLGSCGHILQLVVHHNPKLRHELSGQMSIYLMLLRCGLLCQRDDKARRDFCHLLSLFLFDEIAGVMLSDDGGSEDKFCLPVSVKTGYQLPFSVPTWRRLDGSSPRYPQLPQDDPPELGLSETEKVLLLYSHRSSAVKLTLRGIRTATSHYGVKQSLWQLAHWLSMEGFTLNREEEEVVCKNVCETLVQEDLLGILQRFFEVTPANPDDEVLLREIFHFLTVFLDCCPDSNPTDHFINKLKAHMQDKTPLLELLGQSAEVKPLIEGSAEPDKKNRKSGLLKQVLEFVSVFVQNLEQSYEAWMSSGQFIGSSLVSKLLHGLHLADEFHYYDLPSLEATLRCLMHITARSGWSLDWSEGDSYTLCQQMLRSLLEVVSAFHIGRGGIAISFMGKGVTRNASICLLHLSHEMSIRAPDKNWPIEWAHEIPGSTSPGLQWLVPLWSYRDPEGLQSIWPQQFRAVCTSPDVMGPTRTLWTTILAIVTDHSECSVVRKQAVNLLIHLLSHPLSGSTEEKPPSEDEWVGPRLVNQETQVSVSGKAALLALLNYFHLVPNVITILSYFYPQCTIQPVSVVDNSSTGSTRSTSGPSTATTPDNLTSGQIGQRSDGYQVISPVLSEQSSTVPLIAASFQNEDGPQPSTLSSEGTMVEPRTERAPSSVGYLSVVTPCLVASVCSLLNQLTVLLPDNSILSNGKSEIIKLITGILDPNKAQSLSLATAAPTSSSSSSSSLAAIQYLRMCIRGLDLAIVWLDKDTDVTKLLSRTCQLLHIKFEKVKDQGVKTNLHRLIDTCFNFLTVCIQRGKQEEVLEISSLHMTHITATMAYLLKFSVPCSSRLSSFTYLAHLLAVDKANEPSGPITEVLEAKQEDGKMQGAVLCDLLLSSYDGTAPPCLDHVQHERTALVAAFKNLSAVSKSAKQTALEAGFVETLIEEMKRCHAKLAAENLLPVKKRNKKKEGSLLKQINTCVVILQNLMFNNQDMKVAVKQAGFAQVLFKLWAWIQSTKSLQASVLSALTVYTSHCITACISLTRSSSGQTTGIILNYLIKSAARNPPDQKVFRVITNCLWCDESRNIVWKSGFLSNLGKFQSLSFKSSNPSS
ncbi:Rotatin [Apostichopus japonicus]|uniref:Rotatin n=1 Tax=Stichopus japonicus TaxID=307972 RepID=A0A2G8LCY8_STIJA|nr:Rotatin [Apostichopus japonicus]